MYRLSGQTSQIKALRLSFDAGVTPDWSRIESPNIHSVGSLLKVCNFRFLFTHDHQGTIRYYHLLTSDWLMTTQWRLLIGFLTPSPLLIELSACHAREITQSSLVNGNQC